MIKTRSHLKLHLFTLNTNNNIAIYLVSYNTDLALATSTGTKYAPLHFYSISNILWNYVRNAQSHNRSSLIISSLQHVVKKDPTLYSAVGVYTWDWLHCVVVPMLKSCTELLVVCTQPVSLSIQPLPATAQWDVPSMRPLSHMLTPEQALSLHWPKHYAWH